MKKRILSLALCVVLSLSLFSVIGAAQTFAADNLLKNPDAESGDLACWIDSSKEKCWKVCTEGDIEAKKSLSSKSGKYYFMAGVPSEKDSERYLYQDVSVSSLKGKSLTFSAFLGGLGTKDKIGIKLEILDKKGKVLSSKSSKLYSGVKSDWSKKASVALNVPEKGYTARAYLAAMMCDGVEADCFFDDLSLKSGKALFENPQPTEITVMKSVGNRSIKIAWSKVKGVKGYQVKWSLSKKFKKCKKVFATVTKGYLNKLTKGKRYYLKVRTYKMKGKKKVYSKWCKAKSAVAKQ
ncbi:MAG: hypothetical protein IIU14_02060 [Ruminococcus sp.]|nr:hypothetical protein [Ruminococcus sp.]